MAANNSVTLIGNLGDTPDYKIVGEHDLATFSLAVSRGFGDKRETDWFTCKMWGKKVDSFLKYCGKGSMVSVTGSLRVEKWKTPEGEPRSKVILNVDDYRILSSRNTAEQPPAGSDLVAQSDYDEDEKPPF